MATHIPVLLGNKKETSSTLFAVLTLIFALHHHYFMQNATCKRLPYPFSAVLRTKFDCFAHKSI